MRTKGKDYRDNVLKMITAGRPGGPMGDSEDLMAMLKQAYLAGVNATLDHLNVDREIANSVRKGLGG